MSDSPTFRLCDSDRLSTFRLSDSDSDSGSFRHRRGELFHWGKSLPGFCPWRAAGGLLPGSPPWQGLAGRARLRPMAASARLQALAGKRQGLRPGKPSARLRPLAASSWGRCLQLGLFHTMARLLPPAGSLFSDQWWKWWKWLFRFGTLFFYIKACTKTLAFLYAKKKTKFFVDF